jgi:Protein of unknown function (DUF2911)
MKTFFLTALSTIIFIYANAQLNMPRPSPAAMVQQQVGIGTVTVKYYRPSLRGRKMLGQSSIPYGKVYRLGANEATTFEINETIEIEGKELLKGKYAMLAIPNLKEWTIIINSDSALWGAYSYDTKKDVMRFNVKAITLKDKVETMSFAFENILPSSAALVFKWENIQCNISIKQDADKNVMAQIKEKTAKANADLYDVLEAAEYYVLMNRDLKQALKWTTQVLEKEKSAFPYNLKAQIEQKLDKCKEAIEDAKLAIEYATKNSDTAAVTLAESIIKECKK